MNRFELRLFLEQYAHGSYSQDHYEAFVDWTKQCSREEYGQMLELWQEIVEKEAAGATVDDTLFQKIEAGLDELDLTSQRSPYRISWRKQLSIAASITLAVGLFSYYLLKQNFGEHSHLSTKQKTEIRPGKNTATLTLANGKQIILSDNFSGVVAEEAGVSITKTSTGQLVYTVKENIKSDVGKHNSISTARGETYQINLPDGTQVWLNSSSKLKYPVHFSAGKRKVELEGEGYFEVAGDPKRPFVVSSRGQLVEVLGTHFNINAYGDEKMIKTTLLEGSVRVKNETQQLAALLRPGQVAVNDLLHQPTVQQADIETTMAWKNGLFIFNRQSLDDVLRNVARWYDVEFEYSEEIGRKRLWGTASKHEPITNLMDNIVITSGIHYKIEGRRVVLIK